MTIPVEELFSDIQDFLVGEHRAIWLKENESEICLIIRKEFLERFYPHDGVIVGWEPLNLRWGKPICEEIDGWPSWVADLRLKKVPKEQLEQSIREINWAGDFQKELN